MADNQDRRVPIRSTSGELKRQLNDTQLATLHTLERFGWSLRFVRKSKQGPLAAVYDPERRCLAIIEPDGSLNEDPQLVFRPS